MKKETGKQTGQHGWMEKDWEKERKRKWKRNYWEVR